MKKQTAFGERIIRPETPTCIIGIDPGSKSAAYSIFSFGEDGLKITLHKLDEYDTLRKHIRIKLGQFGPLGVVVFHEHPKGLAWSGRQQGMGSTIKFAESIGIIQGLLIGLNVKRYPVLPSAWQRRLGCLSGGDKKVTTEAAKRRFPELSIINRTADALLIGHYGCLYLLGEK